MKSTRLLIFISILVSLTTFLALTIGADQVKAIEITVNPIESTVGSTDATILWETDQNSDSIVYYTATNSPEWIELNNPTSNIIFDIDFANENLGWAAGRDGTIIHTTDAGNTWTQQSSGTGDTIVAVQVVDSNNIWVLSSHNLLRTTNGGSSWNSSLVFSSTLGKDFYINGQYIYIITREGLLYFSDDAGSTWSTKNLGVTDLRSIDGIDSHIWCVGYNGAILHSSNNGSSWQSQGSVNAYMYDHKALDENNVWAVSDSGQIVSTHDGGQSWSVENLGTIKHLRSIDITPSNVMYLGGQDGTLFYSDDSGLTWNNISNSSVGSVFASIEAIRRNYLYLSASSNLYFYGIDYDSFQYDSTDLTTHVMSLSGLAPSTTYYYYVCSEDTDGNQICSSDYSFTTLAACSDGTAEGDCNASDQYCDGTNLIPSSGPNCVECGFDCTTLSDTPYCDSASQSCVARCVDGTEPDSCNASLQYCDPATLKLSNNCQVNNTQCNFTCPSSDPYCNSENGQCEAKCSDGTDFNQCNSNNQYCDAGTLVPSSGENCVHCMTCASTSPYCDSVSETCQEKCTDGTDLGACSGNQYCDPSTLNLINDCTRCGYSCPADQPYCNQSNGNCEAKCSDGTDTKSCNAFDQYCDSSFNLHTDCTTNITECGFACPSTSPFCDPATGQCVARCFDGTASGACSGDQYCNPSTLTLENNCNYCAYSCPSDAPYCDATGQCLSDRCADGTLLEECNGSQYCDPTSKTLVNNCNFCGYTCPSDFPYCNATSGDCEAKCSDGTQAGSCNGDQYCDPNSFNLEYDCNQCGYSCPTERPYCNSDGQCVEACSDGTLEGQCSGDKYCNSNLNLVFDCRQNCGYTCSGLTPVCNNETGRCEADTTAPVISDININPDVYSALLSFNTSEPAWIEVSINSTEQCNGDVSNLANFDLNTSHSLDLIGLNPSTSYYLCIRAYDSYDNSSFTGNPSTISFTTLVEPDNTPPSVEIISPSEGQEISGIYKIQAQAEDNVEIAEVVLDLVSVNEEIARLSETVSNNIYETDFNSRNWDNGEYEIQAQATDTSGNSTQSTLVNFNINNDVGPPVIEDISAQVGVDTSDTHKATITWTTNEPATSRVDYTIENEDGSFDSSYGGDINCNDSNHCVQDTSYVTSHSITLENLEPNRRYHYRITSCDDDGNCAH